MARNKHFFYSFVDVDVVSGNGVLDVRFRKPTPFCNIYILTAFTERPFIQPVKRNVYTEMI